MSFSRWFKPEKVAPAPTAARVSDRWARMEQAGDRSKQMSISASVVERARSVPADERKALKSYDPAPGVVPADQLKSVLAMDATPYSYLNSQNIYGGFPGYPYLSELAQLPEYRKMVTTLAEEMTRKWVSLRSSGDGDKSKADKIQKLDAAIRKYRLREHFRKIAEHDGYFGRGQLYIDVNKPGGGLATDDPSELETPLFTSGKKITRGSLIGFRTVEAVWTYPGLYQSTSPLAKNFYKPEKWYVMGGIVHDSRLLMFVSRPVPDLLKAAYNFGGLSLTQLAKPYVDHWLRTRDSVSDIVHSFSMSGLSTNLQATLAGGDGEDLFRRADVFNRSRDNRGLMIIDKDSEEFFQFNTPLGGLDALQAQAQEQMSAVSSIPLVKLLGITPTGLNASSDGEIRVFYDYVHSQQEALFREPLKRALDIIQLSEFGEIDSDIDFIFEPLYQLSELELATARKTEAETDAALITAGVISADESRTRIASDPDSPYNSLELNDAPDDSDEEEEGDPTNRADTQGVAKDGVFRESDHLRDQDGKFTDSGASSESSVMKFSDSESVKSEIANEMEDDDDFLDFGLRVIHENDDAKIGDSLRDSYKWVDGKRTKKTLGGTSTVWIRSTKNIDDAIRTMKSEGYLPLGNKVVLVKGEKIADGEDRGEAVIKDAVVRKIFDI